MPKTPKQNLFYKKEACRTKKEKVCRDIVCYGVTIFAAIMGFLLMDANANLADAESDFASNNVEMTQQLS
jgi:hypothetical protein